MRILQSQYKDLTSFVLDGEFLKVTVLPYGGKIASVYHKDIGREFLYQRSGDKYIASQYGDRFSDGEFSGFDDMFPTIDECIYADYPFTNSVMPDHGEVWSMPWNVEVEKTAVNLNVHGVRLPYVFQKRITIVDNVLNLDYQVKNLSTQSFGFIWAAHPLFNCSDRTRIVIPGAERIINVLDNSTRLGRYGEIHKWRGALKDGSFYDMSRIHGNENNSYEKYYVLNEMDSGTASLVDDESCVSLRYPIDKVPYLGVWINEGGYRDQYNVALEPCTGPMDALNIGMKANRVPVLKGGDTYSWSLEVEISEVEKRG